MNFVPKGVEKTFLRSILFETGQKMYSPIGSQSPKKLDS